MGEEEKKGEEGKEKQEEEEKEKEKEKVEEKKEEAAAAQEKEQEQEQEMVLKVDMHCEACARKVARSLKGFPGVEDVTVDSKASKVVVKGKSADPIKVSERIQKKSGRKVEIISPLPKPPEENKEAPPPPPPPEKKEEPPVAITVVMKVQMHCEACAQVVQKRIRKIKVVESVTTDLGSNEVTVKGVVDPDKLVSDVYKRTRKQVILVKNEEKKEEEGKKKEEGEADAGQKKEEEVKAEEEKKQGDGEAGKAEEEDDEKKIEVKKSEYWAPKNQMEYYANYPPQFFSDENPNACSIM